MFRGDFDADAFDPSGAGEDAAIRAEDAADLDSAQLDAAELTAAGPNLILQRMERRLVRLEKPAGFEPF